MKNYDSLSYSESLKQGQLLHGAFIFTVLLGYFVTFGRMDIPLSDPRAIALIVTAVLYCVIGVLGFEWVERREDHKWFLLYFAVQVALASGAIWISPIFSALWLMVLPLVSHAVMVYSLRWTPVIIVVAIGVFVLPSGILVGDEDATGTLLGLVSGVLFVIVFTRVLVQALASRQEIQRLADRLEALNQQLREYAVQAEELATSKERNRLAREIHDSLGHYLTVINVQLEAARAVLDSDRDAAFQALEKAQSLAKDGLSEVRRSVAALRASPMQDRPLPSAIEGLLEECRAAGIQSELQVSGEVRELPAQIEHALYRVTQEGLTNVRRHARASSVKVKLDYDAAGGVALIISDNGVGVDLENLEEGFGLFGLRERVHMLNGRVTLQSTEPKGSSLEVFIPV
jgi:signal transduction histidine kinase